MRGRTDQFLGTVHFVHHFYTCLDKDRNVDLAVPGCLLPKP
jgi:hypothetical protein